MTALGAFTLFHVLLSLAGIGAGFVMVFGLIGARLLGKSTSIFLWTTILTSVTGFMFPFHRFMPSHVLGIISLVVLAVAVYALYVRRLVGGWRTSYVITAVLALYLNFFVLIAQLFMKVSALKTLAPTQSEGPFKITQLVALIVFLGLGVMATRRFRGEQVHPA